MGAAAGVRVWGPVTAPLARLPCGGLRATGVAGGRPGGGPLTVVRGVWCQALSLSPPSVPGAGSQAPLPLYPGPGWCGPGCPAPVPQRVFLRAGVARCGGGGRGSPRGVIRAVSVGVRRPHAGGAGVQAWGPSTVPLARVPCRGSRAAELAGGPGRGGVTSRGCEGHLVSGAFHFLAALGAGSQAPSPLFTGRWWCGRGGPAQSKKKSQPCLSWRA